MATPAFPPTPQAAQKPSPVGTAVSGAQPGIQQAVMGFKNGMQQVIMFQKAIAQVKPEAAQKMAQGIAMIMESIQEITGQPRPGPTQPQGAVPPPPQMAAESPEQTPEAA